MKRFLFFVVVFFPFPAFGQLGCFVEFSYPDYCSIITNIHTACSLDTVTNNRNFGPTMGDLCDEYLTAYYGWGRTQDLLRECQDTLNSSINTNNSLLSTNDTLTIELNKQVAKKLEWKAKYTDMELKKNRWKAQANQAKAICGKPCAGLW